MICSNSVIILLDMKANLHNITNGRAIEARKEVCRA